MSVAVENISLPLPREDHPPAVAACFHCGEPCRDEAFRKSDHVFCCQGCLFVHDLLAESGMTHFYDLSRHPGVKVLGKQGDNRWAYLDEPVLQQRVLDFTDGRVSRVTFHVPAIHCVACVWLLENLFRLHAGIGTSQVNFPRREVGISFRAGEIKLSEVVALLASLGYEPQLTLGELEKPKKDPARQRRWLQIGVAGFAFGNIMLISLPLYLGLDTLSGPMFKALFGYLSLALALPSVIFSAADYWRSAWLAVRRKMLTLDVPIALGLAAIYGQSAYEIFSGHGEGYLDSLTGLIFFLLCGRMFQQKTHDRMAFDRDYKSFFPLSVTRRGTSGDEHVAISNLKVGDRLLLRNGELIPADARLISGEALVDYSFVTGESQPVLRKAGDYLYAGGQQTGGTIELETVKPVSQSYLTSLWNHETFQKDGRDDLNTLTNRYSKRFTRVVIVIAIAAAAFWILSGDAARGLKAFTSVLIVACPCALALAAPFTLGTAQRLLAGIRVFLRNSLVVERLAQVDAVVFDKTGTLTAAQSNRVQFFGAEDQPLTEQERTRVLALARHSTHPHSVRISRCLDGGAPAPVTGFEEVPGKGIQATMPDGAVLQLGSRQWLLECKINVPDTSLPAGSTVCLALNGLYRGTFVLSNAVRKDAATLLQAVSRDAEIALLSGDNERERDQFRALFGPAAQLRFNQSPVDKLAFIQNLQKAGKTVMMVGDGLNDAGALKQSHLGVAVVEQVGAFSPASDIIASADQVCRLHVLLRFARESVRIVRLGFGISAAYNVVGVAVASAGVLSPLICAILMPLSSLSVVLFACGATAWAGRRAGLNEYKPRES